MQHLTGKNDACPGQQTLTRRRKKNGHRQKMAVIYAGW
jgi:hypothetical protein